MFKERHKLKVGSFFSFLFALSITILINAPTIKVIFISTELINLIGVMLLTIIGLMRIIKLGEIKLSKNIIITIISVVFLWFTIILSVFWSPISLDFKVLFQYLSVLIVSLITLTAAKPTDVEYYINMQLIWSFFIALLNLTVGIQINEAEGQHYLTLGFPLGIGLVLSSGLLISYLNNNRKKLTVVFMFIIFFIFLITLIGLRGRSPVIIAFTTILIFWLIFIISSRRNRFINILILSFVGISGYYTIIHVANASWLERFLRLTKNTDHEPRFMLYNTTINLILDKPLFGHGAGSFNYLVNSIYPHNIFLEVAFYAGILGIICLLTIVLIFMSKVIFTVIKKEFRLIPLAMISFYSLMIWNFSYSLGNSYIVFASICFFIGVERQPLKHERGP